MTQELIVELKPSTGRDWTLELQSTFTPQAEELELQQTNFGFLAVRVSRQIAEFWGGGKLTNSDLATGEPAIFGKPSRWIDYSGQQYDWAAGKEISEGITYIDHAANVGQPTRWHVREDGWMGASPGMKSRINLQKNKPLVLRYLLLFHEGAVNPAVADGMYNGFAKSAPLELRKSGRKHHHFEIVRAG